MTNKDKKKKMIKILFDELEKLGLPADFLIDDLKAHGKYDEANFSKEFKEIINDYVKKTKE